MSMDLNKTSPDGYQKMAVSLSQEQKAKITEVRRLVGSLSDKASIYCSSDASISRYLRSQNWNVKKATQMLKQSLKWREEYKPEEIRWDEVSAEAATGKIYRPNYSDKHGRSVLVMMSRQNSKSIKEQMKHFVYCMENAILNLPPNQEEVVWLVDFNGFNLSNLSFKVATETAHVLQNYYPQRLAVAIMYDAPKIFQPFFSMVKMVLEPETRNKIRFVYSNDQDTMKIMEELFDMEQLEYAFGGNDRTEFDMNLYAKRMRGEDNKTHSFWTQPNPASSLDSSRLAADSETSNHEKVPCS